MIHSMIDTLPTVPLINSINNYQIPSHLIKVTLLTINNNTTQVVCNHSLMRVSTVWQEEGMREKRNTLEMKVTTTLDN